ncbi:hypothetical protein [Psychroserpens sp.]
MSSIKFLIVTYHYCYPEIQRIELGKTFEEIGLVDHRLKLALHYPFI